MMDKKKRREILFWIGLSLSLVILLIPTWKDSISRLHQTALIGTFESDADRAGAVKTAAGRYAAHIYNRLLETHQKEKPFSYRGSDASDLLYESLLNGDRGIMGFLEIPMIDVMQPVGHGTREKVLSIEAGHLYGTSLPVGGSGTHAVIAGHTGLTSSAMFDRLTELDVGDRFYMRVSGCRLSYEVERVLTVLPEETDQYLQIREGEDLMTLFTCTPYGINDHRLLVTGRRVREDTRQEEYDGNIEASVRRRHIWGRLMLILWIPTGLFLAGVHRVFAERSL